MELPTTLMDLSKLDNAMAKMLMETVNNMLIELYAAMAQAEIEKKEKLLRKMRGISEMHLSVQIIRTCKKVFTKQLNIWKRFLEICF